MAGRSTDKGQSNSNINDLFRCAAFKADHCLIVIHSDKKIVTAGYHFHPGTVARQRAVYGNPVSGKTGDRRSNDTALLFSQKAAFAGMRIERANGYTGSLDSIPFTEKPIGESRNINDILHPYLFPRLDNWDMPRYHYRAQTPGCHKHTEVFRVGKRREHFCMPRETDACQMKGCF